MQAAVDKAKTTNPSRDERLANGEFLYLREGLLSGPRPSSARSSENIRTLRAHPRPSGSAARRTTPPMSISQRVATTEQSSTSPAIAASRSTSGARLRGWLTSASGSATSRVCDDVFQRLGQVPPAQVDAGLNYAKGKAYYARNDLSYARSRFQAVSAGPIRPPGPLLPRPHCDGADPPLGSRALARRTRRYKHRLRLPTTSRRSTFSSRPPSSARHG